MAGPIRWLSSHAHRVRIISRSCAFLFCLLFSCFFRWFLLCSCVCLSLCVCFCQVPIFSLPQEWLWCETWCSDSSKAQAKTIDLCNNPQVPLSSNPALYSSAGPLERNRDSGLLHARFFLAYKTGILASFGLGLLFSDFESRISELSGVFHSHSCRWTSVSHLLC